MSGFGLSGVKKTKMKEVTLGRKDFEVHESRNGGRRGSTSWGLNVSSSLCLREWLSGRQLKLVEDQVSKLTRAKRKFSGVLNGF